MLLVWEHDISFIAFPDAHFFRINREKGSESKQKLKNLCLVDGQNQSRNTLYITWLYPRYNHWWRMDKI